jgi:hypothetical protein
MATFAALSTTVRAEPPPAISFGRIPAVIDAAISPDGQHVALLGGGLDKRIVSIATLDQPGLPSLNLGDVEGVSLRWTGNSHVLVRLASGSHGRRGCPTALSAMSPSTCRASR